MKKFVVCLLALTLLMPCHGQKKTIEIRDQKGFVNLSRSLVSAVEAGFKDIEVSVQNGDYTFPEDFIVLSNRDWADVSLTLDGCGSIVRPSGRDYRNGDTYAGGFKRVNSFMSPDGTDLELFEHFKYSDSKVFLVKTVPEGSLCKIAVSGYANMPEKRCADTYIQISQTWQSNFFKVKEIKDGWAYFIVKDLKINESKKDYYINDDVTCMDTRIRYKLCNADGDSDNLRILDGKVRLPAGISAVHEGSANRFLLLSGCKLKAFAVRNFRFYGNADKEIFLIRILRSDIGNAEICSCEFHGMQSRILGIFGNTGVSVHHNLFQDCYRECVVVNENSNDARITENRFCRTGKRWQNTQAIQAFGKNYYVAHNVIQDFGTYGIGIGEWQGSGADDRSFGVTEYNEIFYSKDYLDDCLNRALMDSGAIYVYTKNKHAVIRYNRIHDFAGPMDNRGIFCDNGARNFELYGNVITGIANSYCIDSWRYGAMEKTIGPTNVNNVIRDNIVDGPIRFMARTKDSGCKLGKTYVCGSAATAELKSVISEFSSHGAFVPMSASVDGNGTVTVGRSSFRALRRGNPEFKKIQNYIVRK